MTEEKTSLETDVRDSYKERSKRIKPLTNALSKDEFQLYFQALTEYNVLTGKEKPEQKAAAETGLLVMASVLDRFKDTSNRFLYTMAETLFRDYAKNEAGWDDTKIDAYFKQVEESSKPK